MAATEGRGPEIERAGLAHPARSPAEPRRMPNPSIASSDQKGMISGEADDGLWFAAFDAAAHHVEPRIHSNKWSAFFSPIRSQVEAAAALIAAGARIQ